MIKRLLLNHFVAVLSSIQDDGSEDNKIRYFKPGKPLSSGFEHLKAAMAEAFKERFNPFTESDNENDPDMVIDLDSKQDEDADIE